MKLLKFLKMLLEDVFLTNSVTEIGEYAFWKYSSLTNITIPDSVIQIGKNHSLLFAML